jgi:hypothetical protein
MAGLSAGLGSSQERELLDCTAKHILTEIGASETEGYVLVRSNMDTVITLVNTASRAEQTE